MPQLAFSTPESVSLEKQIDSTKKIQETKPEDINDVYEIYRCVEWIKSNNFQRVCLQFPDYLLPDSSVVVLKLQAILNQTLYILGDTAYESCCIDYVAAAHINADAIIHFGPICFSKTSANLPFLNIYEKRKLNVEHLKTQLSERFLGSSETITILLDTPSIHYYDDAVAAFSEYENVKVQMIDKNNLQMEEHLLIFVGDNLRKLTNLGFSFQPKTLYYYSDDSLTKFETESRILKRRNFLVEKIKDSRTIGIVIGTLAVKNYLKIIERVKKLISLSGKKYYLISVGKPTVAKLANFEEIDVYVMITCSLSEIYENRDFYKPVATPFDVEIALNTNRDENIKFSYDYNFFLGDNFDSDKLKACVNVEGDVSLLTNTIRTLGPDVSDEEMVSGLDDNQIALKSQGIMSLRSQHHGAGFLANRTWKGLEQSLGQNDAELAEEGRSGIPQKYKSEEM